jgi:hypothetical protein
MTTDRIGRPSTFSVVRGSERFEILIVLSELED